MILIAEDDKIIRDCLTLALSGEGFEVLCAKDKAEALRLYDEHAAKTEMVLLDVYLPDGTGFEICEHIRSSSNVPILFLTACDDEVHTVLALEQGSDDYISKPFHIRELIARIRAVLRRTKGTVQSVIKVGANEVHQNSGKVYRNRTEIVLSAMEYKLLMIFLNHRGRIMERGQILDILYDELGDYVNDNTLTVYIRRLRGKLGEETIETVRGIGYRMPEN